MPAMNFLNGDRLYIKPRNSNFSAEEQLKNCMLQLCQCERQIYRLNFFSDVSDTYSYRHMYGKIKEMLSVIFNEPVVFSLIAQSPLDCSILAEVFYYDDKQWAKMIIAEDRGEAALFEKDGTAVLIGHVQSDNYPGCRQNSREVFSMLNKLLGKAGFGLNHVVRQWNYIEDLLAYDDKYQRYQEFNNVRAEFYDRVFDSDGYPAATGIGTNCGGVILEFVAVKSPDAVNLPVSNPVQVAAYGYSDDVLVGHNNKCSPKFERARYLELFGKKQLLVSGTASIMGEKTVGAGDPEEQTHITIQNMQRLYASEVLKAKTGLMLQPVYGHARVYVKNREDFPVVRNTFERYYGSLPVVFLLADICRNDLLVEIEGKVILEQEP